MPEDKVYIVTSGSYSSYSIDAVFATKEEADQFVGGASDYDIEEWKLGMPEEGPPRPFYRVYLDAETGNESANYVRNCSWEQNKERPFYVSEFQARVSVNPYTPYMATIIMAESAESYEHALKLAAEHRQAWLRKKFGPRKEDKL